MNWTDLARTTRLDIRPFVDGRYRSSESSETFDTINPATERALSTSPAGSAADIDQAVQIADRRVQEGCWSELSPSKRAEILLNWANLIERHKEELALRDTLEMGKPVRDSLHDAGTFGPSLLRAWAGCADKLFGASAPMCQGAVSWNTYEPRGVIGAITSWNFPTVNAVVKCGPALAAGNSVVLKPSETTPSSALRIAELATEAGIPEGVLNVVPGLGTTVGSALALHPNVSLLSFTGSTATGRKIMELCGRSNGKPLLLECGGKSPHIVFDDATDLDCVAEEIARGFLWNQGQVCTAHTRLIAHSSVKDALLARVVKLAQKVQPKNPLLSETTFGPLASPAHRNKVKRYIEGGIKSGAVLVLRGAIQERDGCYVAPTIFDRVDETMPIVREEIFGPVLCVQNFTTEEEALTRCNSTEYGLAATLWTRDLGRAKRFSRAIRAGAVYVRTSGREESGDGGGMLGHEPQKASGFGAELGIKGLESYSTLKLISWNGW